MNKIILTLLFLLSVFTIKAQQPWETASYEFFFNDSITAKFKPNFQTAYWIVSLRDSGNGEEGTILDSVIILGQKRNGDTVFCSLRRTDKDSVTSVMTYKYGHIPSPGDAAILYQDFYVNVPAGLIAIWGVRINELNILNRRTWISFEAVRRIY